jgi:RHS repeat-associated protein
MTLALLVPSANGNPFLAFAADGPGPHGPAQEGGSAKGRGHQVDKAATDAEGGNGGAPRHGAGEVGDFVRLSREARPFATGPDRLTPFDDSTRRRVNEKSRGRVKVFEDGTGRTQEEISTRRVNFRRADGTWATINTTLQPSGGRFRQTANDLDIQVGGRGDDGQLIRLGTDDTHAVALGLKDAAGRVPTVTGADALYADIFPNIDLRLSTLPDGVKETIILKSASAQTTWVFPLNLQGLTAKINKLGGLDYLDADGKVVASSPHGSMTDSAPSITGDGASSNGVTYEVVKYGAGQAVRVSVDKAWVSDPARKLPILVDPSTYTANAADIADTYADTAYPNTGHSTAQIMAMGSPDNGARKTRAFMSFSGIQDPPATAHATSATLDLFLSYVSDCSQQPFEVHVITGSWTAPGVTNYPGPAIGPAIATGSPFPRTTDACGNNPTDPAKGKWISLALPPSTFDNWNGLGRKGLALTSPNDTGQFKKFDTQDSANYPKLTITYSGNEAGQIDDQFTADVNSLTPNLVAIAHDPDVWPSATLQYQFRVFNATDNPTTATALADSGRIAASEWTIPAGKLAWASNYQWVVQTWDGQDEGPPDNAVVGEPFTTTVRQPVVGATLTSSAGEHGFDPNTANLTATATDATVNTVGPALSIGRAYNSRAMTSSGLFGAGWATQLDMTVTEVKDAAGTAVTGAILTMGDGQQFAFARTASGSFVAAEGFFATLVAVTGGYTLTDDSPTTWWFTHARADKPGTYGVAKVVDGPGRTLTYTWTGEQITRATTASGRSLTFGWTTPASGYSAHVATVTTDRLDAQDPASAQVWTYTYSGDRLTKLCPPISSTDCATYTYQDGSHYPTAVLDSGPFAYWRLGDASGFTATDAVVDNQTALNAGYTNVGLNSTASPIANGAAKAADFNGTNAWVTLPTSLALRTPATSISLWFKTTTADRVLLGWHDDAVNSGTSTATYVPALYIGTDGKLRGQLGTTAPAPITTATAVNNGQWHQAVLTAVGGTSPLQTLYLDGVKVGTLARSAAYPRLTGVTVGAGFLGGAWPTQSHYSTTNATGYASYFNGSISDVSLHTRALFPAEVAAIYSQASLAPGALLTKATTAAGRVATQATWDVVRDAAATVTDANGGSWSIAPPTVTGSSAGFVGAVKANSPLAYWRLGEGAASQAVDESGDVTDLAPYNNVTLGQNGPFGTGESTAAGFSATNPNGTSSLISLPTTMDLGARNTLTVAMFFKTTTPGGVLFGYATDPATNPTTPTNYVPAIYVGTDGKHRGELWNGSVNPIASLTSVTDGQWHYVAIAGGAGSQQLYLDGLPMTDGSGNQVSRAGTIGIAGLTKGSIGGGFLSAGWPGGGHAGTTGGFTAPFTGTIAEVSVYTTRLTNDQVYAQWLPYSSATTSYPIKTITVTDPLNNAIVYRYDPDHTDRVLSETSALGQQTAPGVFEFPGHTTTTGYDKRGYLNETIDPDGWSVAIGNDARGNTVSRTACQNQAGLGCSTDLWTYPAPVAGDLRNDQPVTHQDPRGSTTTTTTTYDPVTALPTDVTGPAVPGSPAGQKTTTTYTTATTAAVGGGNPPPGLVATTTTWNGAVTTNAYYANGDLASTTDPKGLVTNYTYDSLGRVLSTTVVYDPLAAGLVTTQTYDALNRVITRTDPGVTDAVTGLVHTARTTTAYDPDSLVTSTTVADLTGGDSTRTTSTSYDTRGREATRTDGVGNVESYAYDLYGNRTSLTTPDGVQTLYAYDSESRLLTTTLKNYAGDATKPGIQDLVIESRAYDPAGRLAQVTDAMGWTDKYVYFDDGLLASITRVDTQGHSFVTEQDVYNPAGLVQTRYTNNGATRTDYLYDAAGRQYQTTVDPGGLNRVTTLTYDKDDRVINSTLSSGGVSQSIDSAWDKNGNLTSRTIHDTVDKTVSWTRDTRGLVVSMTDPLGNVTSYLNDEAGHQVAIIAPQVSTETGVEGAAPINLTPITWTGYNTFGEPVSTKDANGNITLTGYDAAGRPTSLTSPAYTPPGAPSAIQPIATSSYDAMGRVVDAVDALGRHTTTSYDQLGRVTSTTAPGNATTTMTYDSVGDLLSTTSPESARTESTWDWMGRKLTDTRIERFPATTPTPAYTSTYAYGTGGWLARATSAANVATTYGYNAAGEQTSSTVDPDNPTTHGDSTTYGYDLAGRQISVTAPDGTKHTSTLDVAGNEIGTADLNASAAVLRTTTATYDAADRKTTATDARGNQTTWTRDARGAVTQQTEPVTGATTITTSYGYDPAGNATRFTDGRGNAFRTTYNSWNLPESTIEPSTPSHPNPSDRTWVTSYDLLGRVSRIDAPGGVSTTRTYDARDNLASEAGSGAEAATATRTFQYDRADRMTKASVTGAVNDFTWDDRGDLLTATGGSGNATFAYNSDGRMTQRVDAAGTTTYTWDSVGRLKTLTDAATGTTQTRTYDRMSQLTGIAYGASAATRTMAYDDMHRITADTVKDPGGSVLAKATYGYDLNDNQVAKTTTGTAGAGSDSYTYDKANRLTNWTHDTTSVAYSYDASGNRTGIGGRTQAFDARNRLTSATDTAGTTTWAWTPRGTIATTSGAQTRAVSSDAFDQILGDSATTTSGTGPQAYTYDALGRQISSAPASGGTGPTNALAYSGLGHDLASDSTTSYALESDGSLTATRTGSGPTAQSALAFTDRHQDFTASFTSTGSALTASAAYDPLGKPTAQTGNLPGELGYQSEWTDPATGQVDMWHRHYNPTTSLFDSRDSAAPDPDAGSVAVNRYAYGDDDPLDNQDPTGRVACADTFCRVTYTDKTPSEEVEQKLKALQPTPESQERLAAAREAARLGAAIQELLGSDHHPLDQATAAALRPIAITTPGEEARLSLAFGDGWRAVQKMAKYCVNDYKAPSCQHRHNEAYRYVSEVPCQRLSTGCFFKYFLILGEAALLRYGLKGAGAGAGAADAEISTGRTVTVSIGWKALDSVHASQVARAVSERIVAIRVKFQHLGRSVAIKVGGVAEHSSPLGPRIEKAFQFGGAGRSGAGVKNFVGPPNAIVRGASPGRVFVTDDQGRVILDITRDRVKPVVPGRGFVTGEGRKLAPTKEQLRWIEELWG